MRPGVVALRPLSLGDLFNGAFGYLRDNPRATLGLTFLVVALTSVLPALGLADFSRGYVELLDTVIADPTAEVEEELPLSGLGVTGIYGGSVLQYVAGGLLLGMLSNVVGMAVLGRRLSFGEAVAALRGRWGTLLALTGLYLLFSVLVVALIAVLVGAAAALSTMLPLTAVVPLTLLLGAGLAALTVWVAIKTVLAMPVAVLERTGPLRALVRSWRLTARSFWRLVGILLLTQIIVQVVASVLSTPFTMGSMLIGLFVADVATATVISAALAFVGLLLSGCISYPFTAGVTALLYLDLRMRREGLDLRLRDAVHSGAPLGPDVYLPHPPSGATA